MAIEQTVTNNPALIHEHGIDKCHHFHKRYFSWTGVLAGTLVAIGLGILFHLLTFGVILATFKTDPHTIHLLMMGGLVFLTIFTIVSMFIAGWVSGRIAANKRAYPYKGHRGMLHGFATWSLAVIVGLLLMPNLYKLPPSLYLGPNTIALRAVTHPQTNVSSQIIINSPDQLNIENVSHNLGKTTLAIFAMSLLGAIASCIGGACGIKPHPEDNELVESRPRPLP